MYSNYIYKYLYQREEAWDHLLEWTKAAYSYLDTTPSLNPIDYATHVLYATVRINIICKYTVQIFLLNIRTYVI